MTFRKILCPIDFSTGSQQAMRVAIRIAQDADAALVLAHAWHVPPVAFAGEYVFSPEVIQELRDGAQATLDDAAREATALGARRVESRLLAGMPQHEIVRVLEEDPEFDLAVLGTHGRTGLARVLLGSVAERVVRHAPCSVLTVRPDAAIEPFTRILCPIDFSGTSEHAVELAAELARPGRAAITLLHVIDPPAVRDPGRRTMDLLRDLERSSAEHLDRWAAGLEGKAPGPVAKLSRVGRPGAEILEVLDAQPGFDLVVVGSHGRTGLPRLLLGSVAEKIVRHARCPALVARRREREESPVSLVV